MSTDFMNQLVYCSRFKWFVIERADFDSDGSTHVIRYC